MRVITNRRKVILAIAISLGVLQFLGSIVWMVGGAGIYGSPLTGDPVWSRLVIGFLLTGPMSLLPASLYAIWRPRLAGVWLVITAIVAAWLAVLVMTPAHPEIWIGDRASASNAESIYVYVFKWSLTLVLPFSVPMLGAGLWLMSGGRSTGRVPETK